MKKVSFPSARIIVFLLAESVIYILFLSLDLLGLPEQTFWLKYAGILLCLGFSLHSKDRQIFAAQLLTCCADLFLLLLQRHLLIGVFLFLLVQTFYALRLIRSGCRRGIPLRLCAAVVAILLPLFVDMATPLNILALLYFSQLLCNTVIAWTCPGLRLFALGLTLFVCCDVCVGIYNSFSLLPALYNAAYVGMWLFYLPSQVLIVLSRKEICHETQ